MSDEDVGSLAVRLALDDSSFQQGLQNLRRNISVIDSSFKVSVAGVKDWGKNLDSLKNNATALGEKIGLQKQILQTYSEQLEKSKKNLQDNAKSMMDLKGKVDEAKTAWQEAATVEGKDAEKTQELKKAYEDLNKQYADTETKVKNNQKSIDGYSIQVNNATSKLKNMESQLSSTNKQIEVQGSTWNKVGTALEPVGKSLESTGKKVKDVGNTMTTSLTVPIVGVGAAAAKMEIDFDNSMAAVSTIADTTQVSMADLSKGVIKLSNDTGKSAEDLSQGLYEAISSGVQTGDALNFMSVASKAAIGGFTDTQTAVDGLTTVLNSFGLKVGQTNEIANEMIVTQNLGKTTLGELAAEMGNVAPTAAAANMSTKDLFSSLAVLTANGMKTQVAVTTVKEALSNIIKPSSEAAQEAKNLGLQFNAAHLKSVGWQQFLEEVTQKTHGNTAEMAKLFGSVEALNGVLTLTSSQGMNLYNESIGQMNSNTNYADEAFNKMEDTAGAKLTKSFNELKNAGIQLGESLAPVMVEISKDVKGLADGYNNLSPGMKTFVVDAGLVVAAGGPILSFMGNFMTVGGKTVSLISKLAKGHAEVAAAEKVAATAAEGVATATAGATAATEGAGVAAGTAATATGGLAATLGTIALPATIAIGALAGIGVAAYTVHKDLTQSVVPSVDLFKDKVEKTGTSFINVNGMMIPVANETTTKISESTKKAVGAYMQMDNNVRQSLTSIYVSSNTLSERSKQTIISKYTDIVNKVGSLDDVMKQKLITDYTSMVSRTGALTDENKSTMLSKYSDMVLKLKNLSMAQKENLIMNYQETLSKAQSLTEQQKNTLIQKYTDMGNKIKSAIDKSNNDQLQIMQDFFSKSKGISQSEQTIELQDIQKGNNGKKTEIDLYEKQINDILQKAIDEHRGLYQSEEQIIDDIQGRMRTSAVSNLSETEVESKVILERLKSYGANVTAEQASEMIKNANRSRDSAIAAANDRYNKIVATIIKERDETHKISADQADKYLKEAARQRDGAISAAETTRNQTVNKITSANSTISKNVDTTTGKIMTAWDKVKKYWDGLSFGQKTFKVVTSIAQGIGSGNPLNAITNLINGAYASGTNSAASGWRIVGENGPELEYSESGGETILDNQKTMKLLSGKVDSSVDTSSLGSNIVTGIAKGMNSKVSELASATSNIANTINTTMSQSAKDIFNGFKNQLTDSVDVINNKAIAVSSTLSSMVQPERNARSDMFSALAKGTETYDTALNKLGAENDKLGISTGNADTDLRNMLGEMTNLSTISVIAQNQYEKLGKSIGWTDSQTQDALKTYQDAQKNYLELAQKVVKAQQDMRDSQYNTAYEEIDSQVKSLSEDTDDLNEKYQNEQQALQLLQEKNQILTNQQKELASLYGDASDEVQNVQKSIDDTTQSIKDMNNSLEDTQQKMSDTAENNLNNLFDKLKSALKDYYDDMQTQETDYWQNQIKANDDWKQNTLDNLETVYNSEKEKIENKKTLLSRQNSDEDDQEKINQDKQILSMNYSAKKKAEAQADLDNILKDQARRHQEETLEDQEKALDDKYNVDKADIEKVAQTNDDYYNGQIDSIKSFYAEKEKEANLDAEAQKLIVSNNQKEIVNLLQSYGQDYEIAGSSLGERLVTGFESQMYSIQEIADATTKNINSIVSQINTASLSVPSTALTTSNSYSTKNYNTSYNSSYGSLLHADSIVLNNNQDTKNLMEEIQRIADIQRMSKGVR